MSIFYQSLEQRWRDTGSMVCVGLDPDLRKLPKSLREEELPIFKFNQAIIDATAGLVCAYKPQIAYYAAVGAEDQLEQTIQYIKKHYPDIPVILDAKRNDIGATAQMYAIEAFDRYMADAVTVNPYMGGDTLQPFTEYQDRGVIVLCRTSNQGSGEFQELSTGQGLLFEIVAKRAAVDWNGNHNIALVVGATYPEVLARVRSIVGDMPLLVPGIRAQGGDLESVIQCGLNSNNEGLLINVSRSVIYASDGDDFAQAAAQEVRKLNQQISGIIDA